MGDARRLGQAQRRRLNAVAPYKNIPSNAYADTMKPPSWSKGDTVKANGRYGWQTIVDILPNVGHPDASNDGHAYVIEGGKSKRRTTHLSGELRPFELGESEHD